MEPTVFLIALVAVISVCAYCLYYFSSDGDIELELEEKDLEVEEPMVEEPMVVEVTEEVTVTPAKLNRMTKAQIEDYGRIHGVELDRRKTKANMISELLSATGG
jgi:hypothetical protein